MIHAVQAEIIVLNTRPIIANTRPAIAKPFPVPVFSTCFFPLTLKTSPNMDNTIATKLIYGIKANIAETKLSTKPPIAAPFDDFAGVGLP